MSGLPCQLSPRKLLPIINRAKLPPEFYTSRPRVSQPLPSTFPREIALMNETPTFLRLKQQLRGRQGKRGNESRAKAFRTKRGASTSQSRRARTNILVPHKLRVLFESGYEK